MGLMGFVVALGSGLAAKLRREEVSADVEITRLKEELAQARMQIEILKLALQYLGQPQTHERNCTGSGRARYLGG